MAVLWDVDARKAMVGGTAPFSVSGCAPLPSNLNPRHASNCQSYLCVDIHSQFDLMAPSLSLFWFHLLIKNDTRLLLPCNRNCPGA